MNWYKKTRKIDPPNRVQQYRTEEEFRFPEYVPPIKMGQTIPQTGILASVAVATDSTANSNSKDDSQNPETLLAPNKEQEDVVDGFLLERELELSAFLETQGITDTVAVSRGAAHVFDLAHQLRLKGEIPPLPAKVIVPEVAPPKVYLLPNLMRGPLTLGVMAMMMQGLAFYQSAFSSIGAPGWTLLLGLSMGMVLVSAAMQVLGWRLSMLANAKDNSEARFILLAGLVISLGLAGIVTLVLEGIGEWLEVPLSGMLALGISCIGLTLLMLLNGSLALLGSPFLAGGLMALAFGLIALVYNFWLVQYGMFPTLIGGYVLVCIFLTLFIAFKLHDAKIKNPAKVKDKTDKTDKTKVKDKRAKAKAKEDKAKNKAKAKEEKVKAKEEKVKNKAKAKEDKAKDKTEDKKKTKKEIPIYLPPKGQLFYKALPYLSYGILSVVYVLTGQLCGWSGSLPKGWYWDAAIKALNIAHLLGLMTLVLSQGITEAALQNFWNTMFKAQKQVAFNDYATITKSVWGFLNRYLRSLLLSQLLIALSLIGLTLWGWEKFHLDVTFGPLLMPMFLWILIGYGLLAWGLFECGLLLTLAQPWRAVKALLISTGVQLVSGLTLGWVISFEASSLSVIFGGVCLVLLTHLGLSRLLSPASFGLYQAF